MVLSIIVIVAALIATYRAFRTPDAASLRDNEDPAVASRVFAPAGIIPTAAEREVLAEWKDAGLSTTPAGHH